MKIVCVKGSRLLVAFLLCGAFALLPFWMVAVGRKEVSAVANARALPIYSVEREDKKISISFDCAWGVEHTDEILGYLDEYQVKCTFFAVQFWVEKYPEYAKKIVEKGHELGTHSKTHPNMSKLSVEQIKQELISSSRAIEKATGVYPSLFRPPFGDYDNEVIQTSLSLGLFPIQWDVDSLDWKNLTAEEIFGRVSRGVQPGSIILCHNNGLHTAETLPLLFPFLQEQGYEFVPIGELIYRKNYTIDGNGRQHKND